MVRPTVALSESQAVVWRIGAICSLVEVGRDDLQIVASENALHDKTMRAFGLSHNQPSA